MDKRINLEKECMRCQGAGKIDGKTCAACEGKGTVLTEEGKKILEYLRNSIRLSEH
ncbi:MAG TPA: hypothetical protein PKA28_10350 [Methylomusa anaerophila]|uniref:Tryptophan RNA-binding attenuator protein inhibitory protein n=1 Tax=Methylomusa anaerophila TaxID=1930071 RepID=A0A348AHL2_9FIRM|nr:tryptophan RNA-binding attenuation protein [Methylomusa anaerophila]BBB90560.1 tryptophan RNA-binding attenuator protein inhibitory protein [Methylomusa anaerophila]HML88834.1 hypothetical protein [Methylomusa anaerophila]